MKRRKAINKLEKGQHAPIAGLEAQTSRSGVLGCSKIYPRVVITGSIRLGMR